MEESEPVYLELVDALELYAAIVGGTTRQASDQLRDQAGLEGALARPRSYAAYEDADLADWILSFSSGTTPQQLAPSVRDAMRPIP